MISTSENAHDVLKETLTNAISILKEHEIDMYENNIDEFNRYVCEELFQTLEYFQKRGDLYKYGFISNVAKDQIVMSVRIIPIKNYSFDFFFIV